MPTLDIDGIQYAFLQGEQPEGDLISAFTGLIRRHSRGPWTVALVPGHYRATPGGEPHVGGIHPEASSAERLLACLEAYFTGERHPVLDRYTFRFWREDPRQDQSLPFALRPPISRPDEVAGGPWNFRSRLALDFLGRAGGDVLYCQDLPDGKIYPLRRPALEVAARLEVRYAPAA